jgi:predicted nucleic acid-binding protein
MILFDCSVLCLTLYPEAGIPNDFRTDKPSEFAKERVDGLIAGAEQGSEIILIPTPALSEVLVVVAPDVQKYLDELSNQACFKVVPFGERAAIEVALRTKAAKKRGDKREGVASAWDKVKYDRQIVAIAKVEGASIIYSTDRHIHAHAELWGIKVLNISDLPIPAKQGDFFPEQTTE